MFISKAAIIVSPFLLFRSEGLHKLRFLCHRRTSTRRGAVVLWDQACSIGTGFDCIKDTLKGQKIRTFAVVQLPQGHIKRDSQDTVL